MTIRTTRVHDMSSAALLGRPELDSLEVARLSGIPNELAGRLWQALGFASVPDGDRVFTRRDVDVLRFVRHLLDQHHVDPEVFLQMARATGQSLARIAGMHVSSITPAIEEVLRGSDSGHDEIADRIATLAEGLVESHEPFLGYIWRRHLLAAIVQAVESAGSRTGDDAETASVGFADLVDFTTISAQLTESELAVLVDRFERIVFQVVPNRGGRIVKMLGDEVMFSNRDPRAAAETALALAQACAADDLLPDVRVGVALGPMLAWEGDLYGKTVNLANRIVGSARPGTVLVSDDLATRIEGDPALALVEIRDLKLKGLGKTKVWVLRRRAEQEAPKSRRKERR